MQVENKNGKQIMHYIVNSDCTGKKKHKQGCSQTNEGGHCANKGSTNESGRCMNEAGLTTATRLSHGYGFTRGASETGNAGSGTVEDFGKPHHTAYPHRGMAGIHGLIACTKVRSHSLF
jgi:hypothetical protein